MILREMSMQIKYLAEQGVPKSRIAQHLGVSRQTVINDNYFSRSTTIRIPVHS